MKYIAFIFVILLVGCKSQQKVVEVPIRTETITVEKLIPVQLPADSSYVYAFFECDSANKVILRELKEERTRSIVTGTTFNNGSLRVVTKTIRDTVFIRQTATTQYVEKPVTVEKQVVVNVLKWWQKILIWIGGGASFVLVLKTINLLNRF